MGIFSRKTNENNNDEVQNSKSNAKQFLNRTFETGIKDEVIEVYDIKQINRVKHSNGSIGDVFAARIMKYNQNHAIMPDYGDFIGFEIKPEVTNYLMQHPESQNNLMGWIAYYYNLEKGQENVYDWDKYFLGQLAQGEDGQYFPNTKSQVVEDYFNKYVDRYIQKLEAEYETLNQDYNKQKEEEEFKARLRYEEESKQREEYIQAEINARIKNPYLRIVNKYKTQEGIYNEEYDGINLSESRNKGDILRIRNLEKIGKDGSGTYLYAGYINNTPNEDDVEYNNNLGSVAVCFALYRRLEDIANDRNPEETKALLKFLSNPESFKNPDKLNYLGHFKSDFEIMNNGELKRKFVVTKDLDNSSSAIATRVKAMQRNYDYKHNQNER